MRDLTKEELAAVKFSTKAQLDCGSEHKYEFSPYNSAYLQKKNTDYDLYLKDNEMATVSIMNEFQSKVQAQNHI